MSGRVVHFEIPYDSQERVRHFYTDVFGWTVSPLGDLRYLMAATGPSDDGPPSEPGFINGGLIERGLPVRNPVIVMHVDDIDATVEHVVRLGGSVVSAKQAVDDRGWGAYVRDSEGNLVGLWESPGADG
jgi:predicted enzyme related to lactoylglutathione lyase